MELLGGRLQLIARTHVSLSQWKATGLGRGRKRSACGRVLGSEAAPRPSRIPGFFEAAIFPRPRHLDVLGCHQSEFVRSNKAAEESAGEKADDRGFRGSPLK